MRHVKAFLTKIIGTTVTYSINYLFHPPKETSINESEDSKYCEDTEDSEYSKDTVQKAKLYLRAIPMSWITLCWLLQKWYYSGSLSLMHWIMGSIPVPDSDTNIKQRHKDKTYSMLHT